MKKYLRWLGTAAGVIMMLFFYLLAVKMSALLETCEDTAVIISSAPLDGQRLAKMERQEAEVDSPCDFAAWSQENQVTVMNPGLGRQHTVSAVMVRGRTDLLLRGDGWLDTDRAGSCLIDERTAMSLYGSCLVNGLTLEMNGEEWAVRGILYNVEDTVLCEMPGDSEKTYSMLTVGMTGSMSYESVRQDFMMRHGLAGQFIPMSTLRVLANILCLLIPVITGLRILWQCMRAAYVYRRENFGIIIGVGAVILASLFFLWILSQIELPADLSPTKWSDFSYWKSWWEKQREALLLLLLTEKQRPIQPYLMYFYQVCVYCLVGVIAALKTPFHTDIRHLAEETGIEDIREYKERS